ncbi:MAG: hypothetical protein JXO51_10785, partial [Candidatus Aminicenantes bacterium]|nr:hypothetical protein [Candidatus Aminicenantes bacterium]
MGCRGNVVLALLFVMLLAVSGLALLTHTGLHLEIIAARRDKRLQAAVLEQALLLNLHRFREKMASIDLHDFQDPAREFFNNDTFPNVVDGDCLSRHC